MILKLPRVLQHRLEVHELVWSVVSAELEEVFDDQTGKRERWLYAIKRDTAVNIEYRSRPNLVQVRLCKYDRLHFLRRDVHRESNVMIYHYAVIEDEVFATDAYCKCGPADFLAGAQEPDFHPFTVTACNGLLRGILVHSTSGRV